MNRNQMLKPEEMAQITGGTDDPIFQMTVTWQDANGNTFSNTLVNRKPEPVDPIIRQTVTWHDGNGNTYSASYPS